MRIRVVGQGLLPNRINKWAFPPFIKTLNTQADGFLESRTEEQTRALGDHCSRWSHAVCRRALATLPDFTGGPNVGED